LQIHD